MRIHTCAKRGDIEGVALELSRGVPIDVTEGPDSRTPLMCAAASPNASVETLRFLIERGADVNAVGGELPDADLHETVLGLVVRGRDLGKIALLLDAGADIQYRRPSGYDVLIDAMCREAIESDETLVPIVRLLIDKGAPLRGLSDYRESGLSVASNNGRFDVVRILLAAGADPNQLEWTPLMHTIALGTLQDVKRSLAQGADLAARDFWSRTPWLLSLQTGDVDKAKLLLAAGADRDDRGRCGKTPMMYAIQNRHVHILAWLLKEGFDLEATDDFGTTPLMTAAEYGAADCVRLLLEAGANLDARSHMGEATVQILEEMGTNLDTSDIVGGKAIQKATSIEVIRMLVDAGEDLNDIDDSMRALLTGVEYEGELQASKAEYAVGKQPRFGNANPEVMDVAFWRAMVRSGATACRARALFDDRLMCNQSAYPVTSGPPVARFTAEELSGSVVTAAERCTLVTHEPDDTERLDDGPVWCFHRFGKSITELPDGRFVEIGGEHEDFYDPDFCIYNDVVVHYGGGRFDILGYPRHIFPPTDFHSATLVGGSIYIIGSLGYWGERNYDETPVYRLDCETFAIERIETSGEKPGRISEHRARVRGGSEIHLSGGRICVMVNGKEEYPENPNSYVLDLDRMIWRQI